jgi:hypothetical protein
MACAKAAVAAILLLGTCLGQGPSLKNVGLSSVGLDKLGNVLPAAGTKQRQR